MKTRRSNGKFLPNNHGGITQNFDATPIEKEEVNQNQNTPRQTYTMTAKANGASLHIPIPIPQGGWTIMKVIIILVMFSPWLYLILRKQNRDVMTQKVSDFFEDNFICKPCLPCQNESAPNRTEENPKKSGL